MSANSSSLRPAWFNNGAGGRGGRGFQPPPTAESSSKPQRERSRSSSWGSQGERSTGSSNKFAVLDDDDFDPTSLPDKPPVTNTRSAAFRSSFRSVSTGSRSGRSLADLAARAPEPVASNRRHSSYTGNLSTGDPRQDRARHAGAFRANDATGSVAPSGGTDPHKPDVKVIRYTRERLLSMRPLPNPDAELPETLKPFEATAIISAEPQDPVCWDTFDAEEIWATAPRQRRVASVGEKDLEARIPIREETRRRSAHAAPTGRWQRGVALPPPEAATSKRKDADSPDDLWDDPVGGATGAASDFSAFGAMPPDTGDPFDFDKIAEASLKLEEELHGGKRNSRAEEDDDNPLHSRKVDASRPLTSAGTTITSGSGDDINVFEDFDAPTEDPDGASTADNRQSGDPAGIRNGEEDPSASSRLMKMIGVTKPDEPIAAPASTVDTLSTGAAKNKETPVPAAPSNNPWGTPIDSTVSNGGTSTAISLNPWGDPIIGAAPVQPTIPRPQPQQSSTGLDLTARLEAFANQPPNNGVDRAQQEALLRRRQEDENQRRALAQRQVAEQRAQAAAIQQQQQQPTQHSQVELVLMERICNILEGSWGRSDLGSILSRLHSEDSRVIPLLNNVDALRALIARSPQRVALRRDPSFTGEMAVLLMTNSQWQQMRNQQDEQQRRRQEEEAKAKARAVSAAKAAVPEVDPKRPWFYSDPQQNIQGPFRSEEMRQWLEAGYFKGDLPISQEKSGPFHKLAVIFPNLSVAFQPIEDASAKEAAAAKAKAEAEEAERRRMQEEERLQRQASERAAAKAEAEAREAANRERRAREEAERIEREARAAREAEAAVAKVEAAAEKHTLSSPNGDNDSSNKLKMLLGLSRGPSAAPKKNGGSKTVASASEQSPTSKKSEKKKNSKKTKPADVQNQSSEPIRADLAQPKPAATAWGGASAAKQKKKSMSEIQREEARASAMLAMQREKTGTSQPSGSGWANVAATGKSGWSAGTARSASVGVQPAATAPAVQRRAQTRHSVATTSSAANAGHGVSANQRQSTGTSATTPAAEFGTSMPVALEKWCKEQMLKITGSDDLTLIAFCMTLSDASEIRQYLVEYLGSTAQVNNFATEFINKRGLGTAQQEQWETPGSAKKGRKKKGGR